MRTFLSFGLAAASLLYADEIKPGPTCSPSTCMTGHISYEDRNRDGTLDVVMGRDHALETRTYHRTPDHQHPLGRVRFLDGSEEQRLQSDFERMQRTATTRITEDRQVSCSSTMLGYLYCRDIRTAIDPPTVASNSVQSTEPIRIAKEYFADPLSLISARYTTEVGSTRISINHYFFVAPGRAPNQEFPLDPSGITRRIPVEKGSPFGAQLIIEYQQLRTLTRFVAP